MVLIFELWSLLTYFELVVTRLIEGNGQNQVLEISSVEVKFLTLALHFLCFYFNFVFIYVFYLL